MNLHPRQQHAIAPLATGARLNIKNLFSSETTDR
jgi:hypothetical protein